MKYIGMISALSSQPPAPATIAATTFFSGGAGAVESVSDADVVVARLPAMNSPDTEGTFRTNARLDNATGLRPWVTMLNHGNTGWSRTTATGTAAMAFMPDRASDEIITGDIETVSGGVRARTAANISASPMFVGIQPYYFLDRKAAMRAAWLANPLVSPGPGTDANAVFATANGLPHPVPGRDQPAPDMPLYCYRIGTGPLHVLVTDGTHPHEWLSGYTLEGIVNFLLSADAAAVALRASCTFTIYDDLNPFSRFFGAGRLQPQIIDGISRDSNRSWGIAAPAQVVSLHITHMLANAPATGYSAVYDLHCQGAWSTNKPNGYAHYSTNAIAGGRTNLNAGFLTFLTAQGADAPFLNTAAPDGQMRAWAPDNMGAAGVVAFSAEVANRGFPVQGRAWGERLMRATHAAVQAGYFDGNLPPPPPPPEGWIVTGGVNQLTIEQAEAVTAPAVPAVTGGNNQITITG